MLKMATYPGMSLGGEVRESISLDEDDLSDVEDEVFIRDGKNSYKLAEELNVKRPLMAPRRKLGKQDLTSRLKAKPPCKAFCKPCCYIFAALSILIGLIALVVILVSIFPLPLDKLRDWIISKSRPIKNPVKLLPCSNLKITDVWATNLPVLTTESPVRLLDLNKDGIDDIIFGFGTGDNYNVLHQDTFCPIFLGVGPPCQGGVIALNGTTGDIVWRYWINDTIFGLQCSADLNEDGLEDCLATGDGGSLVAINSRNGSHLWLQSNSKMDVFFANFIPDQNNDSVADILASHTSFAEKVGHLVLISGKTGLELNRIQLTSKTYFMPQLLRVNDSLFAIWGTGTPNSAGNLSILPVENLVNGNLSIRTLYEDRYKGLLAPSVLVDITGDNIPDIVIAMYNSTVVAINGFSLRQIWNYTIPDSETNIVPTPAYFNDDNITDFLIIFEKYDNFVGDNYTVTYIIDGKTGKPIYTKSISQTVVTQENALTLRMESHGFDMFLFWTMKCTGRDKVLTKEDGNDSNTDLCRQQYNTTSIMKLNALNQYDQPPGFEIYNSVDRTPLEFNNTKSPMKQIREYFIKHPKLQVVNNEGQSEIEEAYGDNSKQLSFHKYGSSSFRHKDNKEGIVKDYGNDNNNNNNNPEINEGMDDFGWQANQDINIPQEDYEADMNNYNSDDSDANLFNQNQMLYNNPSKGNRDPRSKEDITKVHSNRNQKKTRSKKKNLSDPKYGIYDYQNLKMARNRLLHDLNNLPTEILRDTFFKNRESQLRKSKFEQRDITSHLDKMKQNEELKTIIDSERKAADNSSYNLWDLESEKELQDKENGYWRGKREIHFKFNAIRKISSVGAIVNSHNSTNNAIDIIFITYWVPSGFGQRETFEQEVNDCIEEKLLNDSEDQAHSYQKTTKEEQRELYRRECLTELQNLKNEFRYFERIHELNLGQMTVYRIKIECLCDVLKVGERCAKFLPQNEQSWPMYLGKFGDGFFQTRN